MPRNPEEQHLIQAAVGRGARAGRGTRTPHLVEQHRNPPRQLVCKRIRKRARKSRICAIRNNVEEGPIFVAMRRHSLEMRSRISCCAPASALSKHSDVSACTSAAISRCTLNIQLNCVRVWFDECTRIDLKCSNLKYQVSAARCPRVLTSSRVLARPSLEYDALMRRHEFVAESLSAGAPS